MPAPAPTKNIHDIVRLHLQSTGQMTLPPAEPAPALTPGGLCVLKRRRDFLLSTMEDLVRKYEAVDAKIKELEK